MPPTAPATVRDRYRVTFAVLVVATIAYAMFQSLVLPVLPTIQAGLHTSESAVTWVLTAYLLSASVLTPIVGRLGDVNGKKRVLVLVLVVLAAGTLLSALATSIGFMIVGRVVQGAGGAVLPLAFGIIRDEFPPERLSMGVSAIAALLGVGSGLGIALGGPIVAAFDYHFLFWLPLGIIVLAAVIAQLMIPKSSVRDESGGLSLWPAVLMTGWLVALLLAVSEGTTWGWVDVRTLGLLAAAAALLAWWVVCESKSAQPLVDMQMMRMPAVWTANLVALLFGVGMYAILAVLPQYLQTPADAGYGFGASVTASGIFLLPMTAMVFCCGLLAGPLADRWGPKSVLLAGVALTAVAFALLTLEHDQRSDIYVFSALSGMGLGFAFSAIANVIVVSVPSDQVGVASGMNANIRTIGGSIGSAAMVSIVASKAGAHGPPAASDYTNGFCFLLVASILAAAAAAIVPSGRRRRLAPGRV